MAFLSFLARLILAATFAIAGVAKATNLTETREAAAAFGLPDWLATPFGSVLPFLELTVAVLLLPTRSATWGGWTALALILVFIAAIITNLALGRRPRCQCFGGIASTPIGWRILVRNGVLGICAVLVIAPGKLQWSTADLLAGAVGAQALAPFATAMALTSIAQVWINFHLFRMRARALHRMDDLEKHVLYGRPIGESAPPFALPALSGERFELSRLLAAGQPIVLVFFDPHCTRCNALLPEIARWQRQYAATLRLVLIGRGTDKANRAKVNKYAIAPVLIQSNLEVAELYQAHMARMPSAVLISASGAIGSRLVAGPEAITRLLESATEALARIS